MSLLAAGGVEEADDREDAPMVHLSPDIIKIDRSLTADLESRAVRALSSALISFAAEMGETVVAEGIEIALTVKTLTDLGGRWGQRYFLGRPGDLPGSTA